MAVPNEIDFALIKIGDGSGSETFAVICGIQDATINHTAITADRFVPDCAAPGTPPNRDVDVNGVQWDVSGSGLSNSGQIATLMAAVGKKKNYKIECYDNDGTATGDLIGTYAGAFVLTANNLNLTKSGQATAEINLASSGAVTYTPAA